MHSVVSRQGPDFLRREPALSLSSLAAGLIHISVCSPLPGCARSLSHLIQRVCFVQVHLKRYGEQLSNSVAFPHHPADAVKLVPIG